MKTIRNKRPEDWSIVCRCERWNRPTQKVEGWLKNSKLKRKVEAALLMGGAGDQQVLPEEYSNWHQDQVAQRALNRGYSMSRYR